MADAGHGGKLRQPLRLPLAVKRQVVEIGVVDADRQRGIAVEHALIVRAASGIVGSRQAVTFDGGKILIADTGQDSVVRVQLPVQILLDRQAFTVGIFVTVGKAGVDVDVL
jgi:hypothetical protein